MSATRICYGLIAYRRKVLCDCVLVPGNYESLCQSALEYVEASSSRKSERELHFREDSKEFQVFIYNDAVGLHYVCVTSMTFQESLAFASLKEVEKQFKQERLHERVEMASPYSQSNSFAGSLHSVLSDCSRRDLLCKSEKVRDEAKSLVRQVHCKEGMEPAGNIEVTTEFILRKTEEFRKASHPPKSCCCCFFC